MRGVIASSHRVGSVEEIPVAIAQAFAELTAGRPRPVHVEVPLDVLEESAPVTPIEPLARSVFEPHAEAVAAAADILSRAERPAIVAGGGARGAVEQLCAVAERLGAPVVTSFNGKGTLPEDHELSGGAGLHRPLVHELVADSDVLLVAGCELSPADLWEGPLPRGPAIVRIDIDPVQVVTNALPAAAVVGDAARSLAALAERLGASGDPAGRAQRAATWRERLLAEGEALGSRWDWLIDGIAAAIGRDGVVAGDSATVCYRGAVARLPRYVPATFLYPTGFGTLGYGLPAAVGAKLGRPEARVLALLGDGGVMFTLPELAAAAATGLPLPVVVVDNGGYGEIRDEMVDRGDEPLAVDLPAVDFVAVARGLGCQAEHVEDADALARVLESSFDADRPTLVHVPGA
jgi:acetolactate synthase-1/2/3 large subunit